MASAAKELRSARMKIQRCEEHLGQLQAEHTGFIDRNPYRMLPEDDFDELGAKIFRVKIVEFPSLRSALDHTAQALVQINRPGSTYSEFPVFKDRPADPKRDVGAKLPGVDRGVLTQTRWLQPYRRTGESDPLWIVHMLDIIDKHRRINLVKPSLLLMHTEFIGGEFEYFEPFYGPFEDGAIVARYKVRSETANVHMQTHFAFDITFGEGKPPVSGQPVMRRIHEWMNYVGGAVARFDKFFS